MKTRRLGASGPDLSVIGYGAWEASPHWGSSFDEAGIIDAIRAGADAGIDWVDTAEVYGPHVSEEIVGKALEGLDHVLIATKVAPKPAGSGFAAPDVRNACEGSLRRLKRERIDLYQLHWPDGGVPIEETWEAMCELRASGVVTAIGVSNFDQTLIERCEKIGHVDSIQPHLSALHRRNADLVRWCGENGIGAVAYGPLAYGLLTGTITPGTTFQADDWRSGSRGFALYEEFFSPANLTNQLARVNAMQPVAERLGITLAQLAIAWVLHQPGVTSAIVGSRNPSHVVANVGAADVTLDDDTLVALDEILG